jgi:hypothetical protein
MTEWSHDTDLVKTIAEVPDSMKKGMGEAARDRAEAREAHGLK